MKLRTVPLTPDKYQAWNKFCLESNDAWYWHTTSWIEFIVNREPELRTENLSFLVYQGDQIKAVAPLAIEHYAKGGSDIKEFSFERWSIPAPALANNLLHQVKDRIAREVVEEFVFKEIDSLAINHNVSRISLDLTPLAPSFLNKERGLDYLIKFGYNNISLHTQLIDLRQSVDKLRSDLRRNHQRNIKKGSDLKVHIYTSQNITPEVFSAYKTTHHRAAGRQTRSDKTFELMFDWLKRGEAFLAAAELNRRLIGFEYYNIYKNNVYGNSAANDPDFGDRPVRHCLEWEAILWMKEQNFSFYEIGLQQYGCLLYDFPDKKQLDIAHFKRGFGGLTVPWFRGEKYYDQDYFLKINNERVQKYVNYIT